MSEPVDVTHREIYDRLLQVEKKIECLDENTRAVVEAFGAAQGAFQTLEFLGKLAKPILWVGGVMTAIGLIWQNWKAH